MSSNSIKYSTPLIAKLNGWAEVKKFNDINRLCKKVNFGMLNLIQSGMIKLSEIELILVDLFFSLTWKFGKTTHYFLDEGVYEFCVNSIKDVSYEYTNNLPVGNDPKIGVSENLDLLMMFSDHFQETFKNAFAPHKDRGTLMIHFPFSEKNKSVFIMRNYFFPNYEQSNKQRKLVSSLYEIAATDANDVLLIKLGDMKPDNNDADYMNLLKFILGFNLYIQAFPESVKPANIGEVKNPSMYSGRSIRVKKSDVMMEENRNTISPHFRRGHFRLLSSDRYKEKRSVFVRGTFVKGSAKKVENIFEEAYQ